MIMSALKSAMDSGNASVTAVVRTAVASASGLDYGEPARENEVQPLKPLSNSTAHMRAEADAPQYHSRDQAYEQGIGSATEVIPNGPSLGPGRQTSNFHIQSAEDFSSEWGQFTAANEQGQASPPLLPPKTHAAPPYSSEQPLYPSRVESPARPPPQQLYNEQGNRTPAMAPSPPGSSQQGTPLRRKPAPGAASYPQTSPLYPASVDSNRQTHSSTPPSSYHAYTPSMVASPPQEPGWPAETPAPYVQGAYGQGPAVGATPAYSAQNQPPGIHQSHNAGRHEPASSHSSYQNITSYSGNQQQAPGDPPYRNASGSSYSQYPTSTVQQQRPPPQQFYSAPTMPQQHQAAQAPPTQTSRPPSIQNSNSYGSPGQPMYYPTEAGAQDRIDWAPPRPYAPQEQPGFFSQAKSLFGGANR